MSEHGGARKGAGRKPSAEKTALAKYRVELKETADELNELTEINKGRAWNAVAERERPHNPDEIKTFDHNEVLKYCKDYAINPNQIMAEMLNDAIIIDEKTMSIKNRSEVMKMMLPYIAVSKEKDDAMSEEDYMSLEGFAVIKLADGTESTAPKVIIGNENGETYYEDSKTGERIVPDEIEEAEEEPEEPE